MRIGVSFRERWFPNGEWILLLALAAEIVLFSAIAQNFFTLGNFFEVTRLSVELGLLAVALTPVIISGGIDLSVGSMMGLSAVVFGAACQDWHLPLPAAAALALALGCAGGALNAWLIARLDIPPLIVTLGTLSLFRGLAEGLTQGAVNYTNFPPGFVALGQGYLWGIIPAQLPIFAVVLAAYAVLLHRSVLGRAFYAIGFTAAGARYAGIPVERRIGLLYVLSGGIASLAAIVYVAHLGQAKSDAGYRLRARRDHGGRAGRHIRVRRARHALRHRPRPVFVVGAAQRPAPGGVALGAHRRPDRDAARRDHRDRSAAGPRACGGQGIFIESASGEAGLADPGSWQTERILT